MTEDMILVERAYLQHLSDHDVRLLVAGAAELDGVADPRAQVRAGSGRVEELLAGPAVFDLVFHPTDRDQALLFTSPFLVFAVAVHRARHELSDLSYVDEWLGPRQRMPVFDVEPLREFLGDPWRRLFLAELLASYTRVASGSVMVATRRGVRRQRFSELDPVRLAGLLEVVPESDHPGVYRRLGDLALFLTGVFPDHTAAHGISSVDETRLLRASGLQQRLATLAPIPGFGDASAVELLEQLGRRWYRLAYRLVAPPVPVALQAVAELADRFGQARRILNFLTDRFLFPFRSQWFGVS
jgi:hypothetical protein